MHQAIGVDIGAGRIHVSFPSALLPPNRWQVVVFDFKEDPLWHRPLAALIGDDAIVALEPTGWHYLVPIISVITQLTTAQVWLVNHSLTGSVRNVEVSRAKTDEMDSRALAFIAQRIKDGNAPRGVRRHNVELQEQVQELRMLVNGYARVTKQLVRVKNQLKQYAHAIAPELAIRIDIWLPYANRGIITPAQLAEYVAQLPKERDRRKTISIEKLSARLPMIEPPAAAVHAIRQMLADQEALLLQQQVLKTAIEQMIYAEPFAEVTRRWQTMPASSIVYIGALHVASHGEVLTMTHVDQFCAALGINPLSTQSGNIDRAKKTSGGYRPGLNALFMWTMHLLSASAPENPIMATFLKHKERGKSKPMRSARAKLASILYGVAHSPRGYSYPYQVTDEGE